MTNMTTNGFGAPFHPKKGEFAKNIRSFLGWDDTELRESLKGFGWVEEFPAVIDENGVVLVGHRRLKLAKELKIEPITKTMTLGQGDEADAKRLRIAIASNVGGAPLNREDRKRLAKYLYGTGTWTMARISEALNVSQQTVSNDLVNLNLPTTGKSKKAKTTRNPKGAGRPKGSGKGKGTRKKKTNGTQEKPELSLDQQVDKFERRLVDFNVEFYNDFVVFLAPEPKLSQAHKKRLSGALQSLAQTCQQLSSLKQPEPPADDE